MRPLQSTMVMPLACRVLVFMLTGSLPHIPGWTVDVLKKFDFDACSAYSSLRRHLLCDDFFQALFLLFAQIRKLL